MQVYYVEGVENVSINVYGQHQGHVSGSRNDLYHLPVDPTVLESCMDDLFDVGTCRHVSRMSSLKEHFHFQQASKVDKIIFRFFMIPKEIEMMSFQLRLQGKTPTHLKVRILLLSFLNMHDEKMIVSIGKLSKDNWRGMYMECLRLRQQNKVLQLFL